VLPRERVWGLGDFTVVNAALAIATWCFITGGYLAAVLPLEAGFAALAFGLLFGFGLTLMGGTLGSCKYGVDLYVQVRSSFGMHGAATIGIAVCMIMVYLNNCIIYPMLGKGITNIVREYVTMSDQAAYWLAAAFAIAALFATWAVVVKGPVYIKWMNWVIAPLLVVVMIILLVFLLTDFGWSALTGAGPTDAFGEPQLDFAFGIEWSIGFAFSWWWIMGAMSRITRTQRASAFGFVVGTAFPAGMAIMIGMMSALIVGTFDPTQWLIPVAGRFWGIVALIFMALANITSGALMTYTGGIAIRSFRVGRKWSWKTITFLVLLPTIITMFFQDLVYTNLGQVLAIWAVMLAPLTAIVFVDYHLLRKQHLDLNALYDHSRSGKYRFWHGWNPAFIITMAASFGFYFWLLNPITLRYSEPFKYITAGIPEFFVACIVYYLVTKFLVIPAGQGGYVKLPSDPAERRALVKQLQNTI
jgi:NCS1 family nucleobase:cation symporter-1